MAIEAPELGKCPRENLWSKSRGKPNKSGNTEGVEEPPPAKFGVSWSSSHAIRCGIAVMPAVPVALITDPGKGLAWAVGILPAAIIGLGPSRRSRLRLIAIGLLFGLSVLLGSLLVQTSVTAVVGIFAVAFGSAYLASHKEFGLTVMALCAPVSAIGLSYADIGTAAALGLVMLIGSVFSFGVFMCWPEYPGASRPVQKLLPTRFARTYGIRLGLAAASATAISIAIHTDHVGWAPAAVFFVMRPTREMQLSRSVGRITSVVAGGVLAIVLVKMGPSAVGIGFFAVALLVGAGGTHESRWYVTPFFSTCLVLAMLLYANPTPANEQWRLRERVGETVLGVGLAYFFGLVVPAVERHFRPCRPPSDL